MLEAGRAVDGKSRGASGRAHESQTAGATSHLKWRLCSIAPSAHRMLPIGHNLYAAASPERICRQHLLCPLLEANNLARAQGCYSKQALSCCSRLGAAAPGSSRPDAVLCAVSHSRASASRSTRVLID